MTEVTVAIADRDTATVVAAGRIALEPRELIGAIGQGLTLLRAGRIP